MTMSKITGPIQELDYDPFEMLDPQAPEIPTFPMLSLQDIRNLPDPEWIVQNFLQSDSFAVLYGAPGSTKSFWALDMACSIASGVQFHSNKVKQGKVMLAAGEGLRGLKWRIESWIMAHPEADEQMLYDNLRIIPNVPHLLDNTHVNMLLNTADILNNDEENPLRLVIIDTWARAMVGGDENSQKDTGLAVEACDLIRKQTGASTLVVHHSGVEGTRERGSTALRGGADTSIMATHEPHTRFTTVVVKKMKDGEQGHQSIYSLKQFGHSVVLTAYSDASTGFPSALNKTVTRDREYYIQRAQEKKDSPF
jgi:hypothetical protein